MKLPIVEAAVALAAGTIPRHHQTGPGRPQPVILGPSETDGLLRGTGRVIFRAAQRREQRQRAGRYVWP